MIVKELVEKARLGDEKAFDELVEHYTVIFVNNVLKCNGNDENLKEVAKEKLPMFIKEYFEKNYKNSLNDYLRYQAKYSFKDKLRLNDTRNMQIDELKKIYSKRLVNLLKKYNSILSEEELYNFCYNIISKRIDEIKHDRNNFATLLGVFFSKLKISIENEETLIIKYASSMGVNKKVENYFIDKYSYLLDEYKYESSYLFLKENFGLIINDIFKSEKINKDYMKNHVKRMMKKYNINYLKDLKIKEDNIRNNDYDKEELYKSNLVLKNIMYDKYKNEINLNEDDFRKIIDEKYDLFFNAYIKGVSKKDLRAYMLTRFNEYFNNRNLPHDLTDEEKEEKEFQKYSNIKYVDKKIKNININYPYDKVINELYKYYDEILEDYFKYNKKTDIKTHISYKLKDKIKKLVLLYNDEEIKNISLKFMNLNLLDKDILEEVITNLTEYYLSNKINNKEPYELFIINRLKNFNYDEYYRIKNIKEHIKIKVKR